MARFGTMRIAWRNLGRNKKRTGLALAAIAIAQFALLVTDGLMNGYVDSMLDAMTGPMLGHVQVHAVDWRDERAMDLTVRDLDGALAELRTIPGVRNAAPRIYAPALLALEQEGHAAIAVGVEAIAERGRTGLLRDVDTTALPQGHDVLMGKALARSMKVSVGDEVALVGQGADGSLANDLFTVRGILSSPIDLVNRMGLVMDIGTAQETFAMTDEAHEITIHGDNAEVAGELSERIAALPRFGEDEVLPWKEISPELVTIVEITAQYSGVVLLLVFIAAAAGVANTILMSIFERRREIGMLLSLGTTPWRVVRMIISEAVVLGLIGVAIGSVLGAVVVLVGAETGFSWASMGGEALNDVAYQGMSFDMEIIPRLTFSDVGRGVVAVVVTSLLAALWPAIHAARLEPVEALRS